MWGCGRRSRRRELWGRSGSGCLRRRSRRLTRPGFDAETQRLRVGRSALASAIMYSFCPAIPVLLMFLRVKELELRKIRFDETFESVFFFQAEDGIRDIGVTGVQTCALPICLIEQLPGDLRGQRAATEHLAL